MPLLYDGFIYSKTFIFRDYFILVILAVKKKKMRKCNIMRVHCIMAKASQMVTC